MNQETGENKYEDGTFPNPNGIEFDNLYLDMNGIIHPCTHPEDKPAPKNEDEMMVAIFKSIDRLMNIVRPRKLLYMAIDGVAPRAKMNQQRSRRFRAAKESVEKRMEIERIRSKLKANGCVLPPEKKNDDHFDSNCITPGTPFMERLSQCLHYYIHDRMNNNPAWRDIKVILSDANVPGEGEHKIMNYIRKQRSQPDYNPNTQHVLCGADADLIMLGLASHEPHFTIICEEFLPNKPKPCEICGQFDHEMYQCTGLNAASFNGVYNCKPDVSVGAEVKYIFVRLSVLREYLKKTLELPNLPFKYEFERVLDDWIFMCFFVGNDFLPHLPSLEIQEGAIDRLVEIYKKCIYHAGGFITDSGEVNLDRLQLILTDLANVEDQIFKDRHRRDQQFKQNEKAKRRKQDVYNSSIMEQCSSFELTHLREGKANPFPLIDGYKKEAANWRNSNNISKYENQRHNKRTASQAHLDDDDEEEEFKNDEIRLWQDGFIDRYYESKFHVDKNDLHFRYVVALQYVRGLCWVLKYYYQGCPSWTWYFPHHYAPFASDFINIAGLSTQFEKDSKPFHPLEQLMAVFPAASSSHVPKPWAKLMHDPHSPIIDFYPKDFKIDLNGKKFAWQGISLLPFVDENRLFKALAPYYEKLTKNEIKRNKQGDCKLYIGRRNKAHLAVAFANKAFYLMPETPINMDDMRGVILKSEENIPTKGTLPSPIMGLYDITDNHVITVKYRDPVYDKDFVFPASRLPNAIDPPNVLVSESRSSNFGTRIGEFNNNMPQADVDATQGGHRILNNSIGNCNQQQQQQQHHHQQRNSHQQQSLNYNNRSCNSAGYHQRNSDNYFGNIRGYNNGNSHNGGNNGCFNRGNYSYQRQQQNNQNYQFYNKNHSQSYSQNNYNINYNYNYSYTRSYSYNTIWQ